MLIKEREAGETARLQAEANVGLLLAFGCSGEEASEKRKEKGEN